MIATLVDLDAALTAIPRETLYDLRSETLDFFPRRSALRREVLANGRSPLAYEMAAHGRTRRRIVKIIADAIRLHPDTLRAQAEAEAESWRIVRRNQARRNARATENRRARELGHCPRCVNGYIPNMPVDGGVCYRCGGTGRP